MVNIAEVLFLESIEGNEEKKYKCKLFERDGDHLYINYPINLKTNKPEYLLNGKKFTVTFVTKEGHVYFFETHIIGKKNEHKPLIILSYPGDKNLKRIQRRQFVRIETSVDVAVHPIQMEFSPFETTTVDISAGGAAIYCKKNNNIKPKMILNTQFVLPEKNGEIQYLQLKSKVMRVTEINKDSFKVSMVFIDVAPIERQLLLRFCFERQLERKKKDLKK